MVAAHTIGFVIAIPNARQRARELAATGHSYWSIAVAVAVIASTAALVAAFGRGRHSGPVRISARRRLGQWTALSAWQVVAFAAMEVSERLEVGEPLHALLDERAFRVGVTLQLVVAAIAIALLALAECAGSLVVRVGRAGHRVVTAPALRVRIAAACARGRVASLDRAARAPPAAATL